MLGLVIGADGNRVGHTSTVRLCVLQFQAAACPPAPKAAVCGPSHLISGDPAPEARCGAAAGLAVGRGPAGVPLIPARRPPPDPTWPAPSPPRLNPLPPGPP